MYCNACGNPVVAGRGFCPRCGQQVAMDGSKGPAGLPPGPLLPLGLIDRRIHTLALGWFVYAALIGIGGLFGMAWAHAALSGHMSPFWDWHGFGHHGWSGHALPFVFWPFVAGAYFLRVALAVAAAIGLMQRTRWGRMVAIVGGCLALIHIPFGTALGVWTLITLLSAPNALGYEMLARN